MKVILWCLSLGFANCGLSRPTGECNVINQVHYNTFDGKCYNFEEFCDYVLVQEIVVRYNLTIIVDNQICDPVDDEFCPQAVIVYFQSYKIVLTQLKDIGLVVSNIPKSQGISCKCF